MDGSLAQWHTQGARKAPPGMIPTHTADPALGSLCPFFPGWQGAMPDHKASFVETQRRKHACLVWSALEQIACSYQIARSFLGTEIWSLQKAEEKPLKVKANWATQNALRYVHLWVIVFHELFICVTKYYRAIVRHIQRSGPEESNCLTIKYLLDILILTA